MDVSRLFEPHQNLSDAINRAVVQSDIEGGVYLRDLPTGSKLEVQTENHFYTIVQLDSGQLISGHPEFCPEPVLVKISGSNWGGSMLMAHYLGRGMHMEFRHPDYPGSIVTSRIVDIKLLSEAA